MSPTPAPRLRYFPFWLACGWGLVALVVYLSLTPTPPELPGEEGDKVGHLLAYAALMAWFAWLYSSNRIRWACALGFIALGVGLEYAQGWTGYRSFSVGDMLADTAGVCLGWVGALLPIPGAPQAAESLILRRRAG